MDMHAVQFMACRKDGDEIPVTEESGLPPSFIPSGLLACGIPPRFRVGFHP
jgi:hypothetical protein